MLYLLRAKDSLGGNMQLLTMRQADLFKIIHRFISKNEYSPSHRQMAAQLGLRVVRSVQQHIEQLERKGYITHMLGVSRNLRIMSPYGQKVNLQ